MARNNDVTRPPLIINKKERKQQRRRLLNQNKNKHGKVARLTHDPELDSVAGPGALDIGGSARVLAGLRSGDPPDHQGALDHDDTG